MCGFVGIINASNSRSFIDEKNLNEMRDEISHRGPDDSDNYIDSNIALGFRRLSILDLSANGRQPMSYKNFTIIFNGEIFNFQSIKDELLLKNHKFISTSDTEVILHAYEEWGIECVSKFNGMFAVALYDKKEGRVILIRDRLGVKPLYYTAINKEVLVFASEIKGICKYKNYHPRLNINAVHNFFRYTFVPGEDTLFESIKQLLPGHYLTYDIRRKSFDIKKYWELPDEEVRDSFEDAKNKIDDLLNDSVKLRLISDVPVGVQLSGGLDSSLVAYYASRQSPNIFSISINVDDDLYTEKSFAEFASKKLGLSHHSITLDSNSFFHDLDRLLYIYDEPLPHANSMGIYLLSQYAKQNVTVLLSGEGADELFCGYDRYVQIQKYHNISKIPFKNIRQKSAEKNLPGCFYNYLVPFQTKPHDNYYIENVYNSFRVSDLNEIINEPFIKSGNSYISETINRYSEYDYLNRASRFDIKNYLVALLQRQDRMSMAFSIENRVPFLDYRIVEYVTSLPSEYKVKNGIGKYILKELATRYFPKDFVYRPKQGFGIPLKSFLNTKNGKSLIRSIIDEDFVTKEVINTDNAIKLFNDFLDDKEVNMGLMWGLLTFEKWARLYFKE